MFNQTVPKFCSYSYLKWASHNWLFHHWLCCCFFSLHATTLDSCLPPPFHSRLLHRQLRWWDLPAGQSPGQHARQQRLLRQEHQTGRVRPAGDRNRGARYQEADWRRLDPSKLFCLSFYFVLSVRRCITHAALDLIVYDHRLRLCRCNSGNSIGLLSLGSILSFQRSFFLCVLVAARVFFRSQIIGSQRAGAPHISLSGFFFKIMFHWIDIHLTQ